MLQKYPPTHILWSPKTEALHALLNWSDGHADTHVFVSLSVPTLCRLFVFRHVCLHWLHNIFHHQNDAAVPLFAQASGLSTSMWHATLSPPVITMVMALQHWVKYHLTLSDPQLSQSKHWNVTGPQKDTWCTLGTESVLRSGAASDSCWRENAKWSFTFRIKAHHSGQFCTTEAN